MADYYVYSGAGGTNDGSSWANAFTSLKTAMETPRVAGDRFFVAHDHSESLGANTTITSPGTYASPQIVLCVNRAGSVPPVSADLQVRAGTFGTSGTFWLDLLGYFYVEGMIFSAGGEFYLADGGSAAEQVFRNCKLSAGNTGNNCVIGSSGGVNDVERIQLINTDLSFGNSGGGLVVRGGFELRWWGGTLAGTAVAALFQPSGNTATQAVIDARDVDLSLLAGSSVLVNVDNVTASGARVRFERCRLSASLSGVISGTLYRGGGAVDLVNCDSGTGNYREEHYRGQGSIKQETVVVRTDGATDGTTPRSLKMVSGTDIKFYAPLEAPDTLMWIDSTGSKTFTLELVTDNVTLKDTEFWLEIEYLGNASYPLGTFGTTGADILATGSNLTSSSVTWTTTGLTTPVKQKASKTVTVNMKGLVRVRPVLAKASTTVYVDPVPVVT